MKVLPCDSRETALDFVPSRLVNPPVNTIPVFQEPNFPFQSVPKTTPNITRFSLATRDVGNRTIDARQRNLSHIP